MNTNGMNESKENCNVYKVNGELSTTSTLNPSIKLQSTSLFNLSLIKTKSFEYVYNKGEGLGFF